MKIQNQILQSPAWSVNQNQTHTGNPCWMIIIPAACNQIRRVLILESISDYTINKTESAKANQVPLPKT